MGDPQPYSAAETEENQPSRSCKGILHHVKHINWLHRAAERGDHELISHLKMEERHYQLTSVNLNNGELPLHCAARGGHVTSLELLLPADRPDIIHTELNAKDHAGNTPLHLAISLGHKRVVQRLVAEGANLFSLNEARMMPISFCNDQSIFEALISTYNVGSASFKRAGPGAVQELRPADAVGRTILHYAAQFGKESNYNAVVNLITEMGLDGLDQRDIEGDSFLHVAAKSGNVHILRALQSLKIDVAHLMIKNRSSSLGRSNSLGRSRGQIHSPAGMYALLHNHRDFFDQLITMSKVEITLSCIIKALIAELIDNPQIQKRLPLFASTLPTYLALYANKHCIFNFLLETNLLSLSQWDEDHKRTCLHWAVLDKRTDIIQRLCDNVQLSPEIQDRDGKTALQHAVEQNNHNMVTQILGAKPIFKDYEEKLYRDRDVYVQALNAILVVAALIASVTFAGWLQWPSTANFNSLGMKIFWASNSASFFTAVATMFVTTAALLPTSNTRYVGDIVKKLRLVIVVDAGFFALSLGAVVCAFASVGFAAIQSSYIFTYQAIMRATTAVGGFLSLVVWLAFVSQVYKSAPPTSDFVALMLPDRFRRRLRPLLGDSSSSFDLGYRSLPRRELITWMDKDLVPKYQASGTINTTHAANRDYILLDITRRLNISDTKDKDFFISGIDLEATEGKQITRKLSELRKEVTSSIASRTSDVRPY